MDKPKRDWTTENVRQRITWNDRVRRKYKRGSFPCSPCQTNGQHAHCRPRLDMRLCSCSCPKAVELREEVFTFQQGCRARGLTIPTMPEILQELGIRKQVGTHEFIEDNGTRYCGQCGRPLYDEGCSRCESAEYKTINFAS